MDLDDFAELHFRETRGEGLFESPVVLEFIDRFEDPDRVASTVATAAWQILSLGQGFTATTQSMHLPSRQSPARGIIVPYSTARFGLLMFYPELEPGDVRAERLRLFLSASYEDEIGWNRWRSSTASQIDRGDAPLLQAIADYGPAFATDLVRNVQFEIVATSEPDIEVTSVPVPAVSAQLDTQNPDNSNHGVTHPAIATTGIVAEVDGIRGATVPCHLFSKCGVTPVAGVTTVDIGSRPGVLRSVDPISDSCFVELPPGPSLPTRQTLGPLRNVTPRQHEVARFWGHASGERQTLITGWSLDLLHVAPWNQLKVFTRPCTRGGDSGAALVDSADYVLGFSHYRTGLGANVEFSAWVWADSVYSSHRLSPIAVNL